MYYVLKVILTAVVVVGISELGKRFSWAGALLASLPLTSILALSWIHIETGNAKTISDLSWGIFWMVLPSLLFFVVLPLALKKGMGFWAALGLSCFCTFLGYSAYVWVLKKAGVEI